MLTLTIALQEDHHREQRAEVSVLQSTHCCQQAIGTTPVAHAAASELAEAAFGARLVAEACSAVTACKDFAVKSL